MIVTSDMVIAKCCSNVQCKTKATHSLQSLVTSLLRTAMIVGSIESSDIGHGQDSGMAGYTETGTGGKLKDRCRLIVRWCHRVVQRWPRYVCDTI